MTFFCRHQIEYQGAVAKQRSRILHKINCSLFAPLLSTVSTHEVHKMLNEFKRSFRPDFN